jgi:hypothetical protein
MIDTRYRLVQNDEQSFESKICHCRAPFLGHVPQRPPGRGTS